MDINYICIITVSFLWQQLMPLHNNRILGSEL